MSAATQNVSRYRSLRGKSVSESRTAINNVLDHGKLGRVKEQSPPLKTTLKRRSKSLGRIDTSDIQTFAHNHSSIPPVPPVAISQFGNSIVPGPRADGIPPVPSLETEKQHEEPDRLLSPGSAPRLPLSAPATMTTMVTTDVAVEGERDSERQRWKREDEKWTTQERRVLSPEESAMLADKLEGETDRILAEQKKLDLARLHQHLVAAHSAVSLSPSVPKPKSPVLEKFSFFNRARSSKAATLSPTSSTTASVDISRTHSLDPSLPPRAFIELGGQGQLMTPPMSPISPHHFHERRVTVRCRGVTVNLVVVAESSPVDILFQASESITQQIHTAASLVYECYTQLGLERRLRRYERICDVLDSWDHDAQNVLLIIPSSSCDDDKDLDISSVPATVSPPPGLLLLLHHSSRPGKWNKRWITLLDNGQIVSSKKEDYSGDKSVQWLCHLSEYDIYTLMSKSASGTGEGGSKSAGTVAKNLKPPKKFVYALKLQQKASISDDSANFVHFFCTDDPSIAKKFTAHVHGWRSWYMVKARRDAQRKRLMDEAPQITPVKHKPKKSVSHVKVPGQKHRMRVSVDETPYTIGDFQPLVEMERFEKPIDEFGKDWIPDPRLSALSPTTKGQNLFPTPPRPTVQENTMADIGASHSVAQETRNNLGHRKITPNGEAVPQELTGISQLGASTALSGSDASKSTSGSPKISLLPTEPGPGSGPEAQSRSWLPSAVEHSARQRQEQERLARSIVASPPHQQQRPSAGAGAAQPQRHYQYVTTQARGTRQGGSRVAAPSALGDIARNYRTVSRWAEAGAATVGGSPKFLEVPHGGSRGMSSLHPPPPQWQNHSFNSPHNSRPYTSGGERGRYQQQNNQQQKQPRARTGSVSSMRRGPGTIGCPPPDPPPLPPMPPHLRALARDVQR